MNDDAVWVDYRCLSVAVVACSSKKLKLSPLTTHLDFEEVRSRV